MKKLKIIFLLCLVISLLPGCGSPAVSSEASVTPAAETNAVPRVVLAELFTGDW